MLCNSKTPIFGRIFSAREAGHGRHSRAARAFGQEFSQSKSGPSFLCEETCPSHGVIVVSDVSHYENGNDIRTAVAVDADKTFPRLQKGPHTNGGLTLVGDPFNPYYQIRTRRNGDRRVVVAPDSAGKVCHDDAVTDERHMQDLT